MNALNKARMHYNMMNASDTRIQAREPAFPEARIRSAARVWRARNWLQEEIEQTERLLYGCSGQTLRARRALIRAEQDLRECDYDASKALRDYDRARLGLGWANKRSTRVCPIEGKTFRAMAQGLAMRSLNRRRAYLQAATSALRAAEQAYRSALAVWREASQ